MEIEGKVLQIMPVQNIPTQKGTLKKLEFAIEVESKFPKKVAFTLFNEKIDGFTAKPGETVKVFFDLESREYNGKWYTEAKAWKVENMAATASEEANNQYLPPQPEDLPPSSPPQNMEMDDLPF